MPHAYVEGREQIGVLVLPFYHVSFRNQTQVIRLISGKCVYPLNISLAPILLLSMFLP